MENQEISTYIIKVNKYTIFILLYVSICAFGTAFLTVKLNTEVFIWIGMPIMILPGIFQGFFTKRFTIPADLLFTGESLTVSEKEGNNFSIPYKEIVSLKVIDSSKDDSSFVRFNLRNGNAIKFSFIKQRVKYLKTPITDVLFDFINDYNCKQPDRQQRIVSAPALFARKAGKIYIYIIYAMLLVCVVLQIFLKPATIPYSLLGALSFTFVIAVQRKRDIEMTKRIIVDP